MGRDRDTYWRRAMALFQEDTADLFPDFFLMRTSRDLELGEEMKES